MRSTAPRPACPATILCVSCFLLFRHRPLYAPYTDHRLRWMFDRAFQAVTPHSALMPACFATLVHLTISARIHFPNSSGVRVTASAPSETNHFWVSGVARTAATSLLSFLTMAGAIAAGPTMPHQL